MATDDLKARLIYRAARSECALDEDAFDDALTRIVELEAQLAARDAGLTDEIFAFAMAVFPDLEESEFAAACAAGQVDIDSLEAQRFEAMFIAAMKARKTLIEATAIASGDYAKGQTDAQQGD